MGRSVRIDEGPWSGAPFVVRVRRSGQLGIIERGTPDDVPVELVRLATAMFRTSLTKCSFLWRPNSDAMLCRVTVELHTDGSVDHVLLAGEQITELPHGLSGRELEVLTLLVTGRGNVQVAEDLFISDRTAASHIKNVLQKLGMPTRTAAATYALDAGLLQVPLPGATEYYAKLSVGRLVRAAAVDQSSTVSTHRRPSAPGIIHRRRRKLVVGAAVPRTGLGRDDGREMLNGLQLAMDEINAAGGVRGREVKPLLVDVDVTSSVSVRSAFDQLLSGGADVLTSGYLAAQDVAHEIAGDSGIPYLHAATSGVMERAVQNDLGRFGHVFQVCASDTSYAPAFVSYMQSLCDAGHWRSPSKRLVVLQKNWSHVDFGVSAAASLAEESGWQLEVVPVTGSNADGGWARAVQQALTEPAAAVMIGSYFVEDVEQAVLALHDSGSPTLAYAIYAPSVPAFRDRLGAAAEGVLWATMTGTYSDTRGVAFSRRYTRRFGVRPGRSHAGLAYDRMHRIALAWRMSEDLTDPGEVATALRSHPYRGVNGTYNFDTPGQAAQGFAGPVGDPSLAQPQLIFQIQDGAQVIVSGGPFTTGEFRLPGSLEMSSGR
ncbi:ABC transporter substrate-binding protein [Gordonia sp. HNM0687]|uniref:ABC transporter substrate-binding protein n=1 Tax=Gordonia mangrovi TaxID=2665643 RepID=A0A6L7GPH6_9ACTN|nr:ABC transporter substrate-binding protein [Gordonia mangrovi]MXP21776.1 ABC transporter substrate-binding protein [Gordonia mangrovi]UVF80502.1 ABC transporter substrate-binding protein [Gordonia mangrovi]